MDVGNPADTKIRALIEDLGCCSKGHYCTMKEILISSPRDARILVQIKCVEKFKYERSEREHRALDWTEAFNLWVSEGLAQVFDQLFRDDMRVDDLYRAVMRADSGENGS